MEGKDRGDCERLTSGGIRGKCWPGEHGMSDPNLGVLGTDPETMLTTRRCGVGYMGAKQDGVT